MADYGWRCAEILGVNHPTSLQEHFFGQGIYADDNKQALDNLVQHAYNEYRKSYFSSKEKGMANEKPHSFINNNSTVHIALNNNTDAENDITAYYSGLITRAEYETLVQASKDYNIAYADRDYSAMSNAHAIAVLIRSSYNENYVDNYDYTYGGIMYSTNVSLGNGWSYRVDRPHYNGGQTHVHVNNKYGNSWAQNENGTVSHKGKTPGTDIPGWVKYKLKNNEEWDWDGKAESNPNNFSYNEYGDVYINGIRRPDLDVRYRNGNIYMNPMPYSGPLPNFEIPPIVVYP